MNNDVDWKNDGYLAEKIYYDTNNINKESHLTELKQMGKVVECCHSDTITLAKVSFYQGFEPLAYSSWNWPNKDNISLLKDAADKLGYRLVKKS